MKPNWLSLKIALLIAATYAALTLATELAFGPFLPGWLILSGPFILGGLAYAIAYAILARRIDSTKDTLKRIRQHDFERIDTPPSPRGDEMSALIWEVHRTGQALEREIQELKKMENYRREFIGNVSHELKTPIFTIHGFAETLLEGALEDEEVNRSFVKKILRNADRLSNLAEDLSQIVAIETGELQMTPSPFDLKKVVREVSESLELSARQKNITLNCNLPDKSLPPAIGDRERIRQVVSNLADNAIKYNNPGGKVTLKVEHLENGDLKASVADDGIGIKPEHVERITERFYRVDQSRSRDQGGTGLGLAIVKHILGAHQSSLQVESTPGEGSTFSFRLRSANSPHTFTGGEK